MKKPIRIFICHENQKCRDSLQHLLKNSAGNDTRVVGEAGNYKDCQLWLVNSEADVVLINFPRRVRGTHLIMKGLVETFPDVKFITMSAFETKYLLPIYNRVGVHKHFFYADGLSELHEIISDSQTK